MSKNDNDSFLKRAFVTRTNGYTDIFSKRDLWAQIAKDFDGKFRVSHTSGNELEIHRIYINYKNWEIVLSESDSRPLRFEIMFATEVDFDLVIGWEDSIEKILKKLGKREIEIGDKKFDDHYLIKSNDSDKTKRLLSSDVIDLMIKHNVYSISYQSNLKKQKSSLVSVISSTIDEKDIISDLIHLHFKLIDNFESERIIK